MHTGGGEEVCDSKDDGEMRGSGGLGHRKPDGLPDHQTFISTFRLHTTWQASTGTSPLTCHDSGPQLLRISAVLSGKYVLRLHMDFEAEIENRAPE